MTMHLSDACGNAGCMPEPDVLIGLHMALSAVSCKGLWAHVRYQRHI